jgi:hypothetical protein
MLPTTIKIDANMIATLGLDGICERQAQLAAQVVLTRAVCPCEAAHILSGLPIIKHSVDVKFVNTKPPQHRTVQVTMRSGWKQASTSVTPLQTYMARPNTPELENITLPDYFRNYEVRRLRLWLAAACAACCLWRAALQQPRLLALVALPELCNMVLKRAA